MIQFKFEGEVQMVAASQSQQGFYFVKVMPIGIFKFDRQGEMPAAISVKAPSAMCAGLTVGQRVKVEGTLAIATHEWTAPKKNFSDVPKVKLIENNYFTATKIDQVKVAA